MSGAFDFDPWAGAPETSKMEVWGAPPANPAKAANPTPRSTIEAPISRFSRFSSPDPAKLKNAISDEDAETEAMRQHYAAPAGPGLPPDQMKAGLLRGFYSHRPVVGTSRGSVTHQRPPVSATPATPPPSERTA